jgi:hypothetical protein
MGDRRPDASAPSRRRRSWAPGRKGVAGHAAPRGAAAARVAGRRARQPPRPGGRSGSSWRPCPRRRRGASRRAPGSAGHIHGPVGARQVLARLGLGVAAVEQGDVCPSRLRRPIDNPAEKPGARAAHRELCRGRRGRRPQPGSAPRGHRPSPTRATYHRRPPPRRCTRLRGAAAPTSSLYAAARRCRSSRSAGSCLLGIGVRRRDAGEGGSQSKRRRSAAGARMRSG